MHRQGSLARAELRALIRHGFARLTGSFGPGTYPRPSCHKVRPGGKFSRSHQAGAALVVPEFRSTIPSTAPAPDQMQTPEATVFSLFKKNPTKKLEQQHAKLLEQAMQAQRNGDIRTYSKLTAEAEEVFEQIERLSSSEA